MDILDAGRRRHPAPDPITPGAGGMKHPTALGLPRGRREEPGQEAWTSALDAEYDDVPGVQSSVQQVMAREPVVPPTTGGRNGFRIPEHRI